MSQTLTLLPETSSKGKEVRCEERQLCFTNIVTNYGQKPTSCQIKVIPVKNSIVSSQHLFPQYISLQKPP